MLELSGRLFPNGEFGLARIKRVKVSVQRRRVRSEHEQWAIRCFRVHGLSTYRAYKLEVSPECPALSVQDSPPVDPLGLSLLAKSHRGKRGSKGISRYSARMVRNAAFLLQRKYGRSRLSFLTYTLPSLSPEEWEVVCAGWSEIVRVVLQRLRRNLVRCGLPDYVVSVTELQEGRLKRDRVPGLHLHILFVGRKEGKGWSLKPSEVRSFWMSALESCLGYSLPMDRMKASENIQQVRKSAEGYLGKYMTKGSKSIELARSLCPSMSLPSSWSNLSASLRNLVLARVLPIGQSMARVMIDMMENDKERCFQFTGRVEKEMEGGRVLLLGVYGKVRIGVMKEMVETYCQHRDERVSTFRDCSLM